MNIMFETALKYIDLGSYDKAVENLNKAIEEEKNSGNEQTAIEYTCVLGELLANMGKKNDSRKAFLEVFSYCEKNKALPKQREIAAKFLASFEDAKSAKPIQNKAFISRQMRKRK